MPELIEPDWPAPDNVVAFTTTRRGGVSVSPYESWNLGFHVGDDPAAVAANCHLLAAMLPAESAPCWLEQVHGTRVVEAGPASDYPTADAAWSRSTHVACAILTADCLPVLLCDQDGGVVAAAHAGWRGLVAGVLEQSVAAMNCDPGQLMAWLGPAIGPVAFEVGPEVREQFMLSLSADPGPEINACFAPSERRAGHYLADLYSLARIRLRRCGVLQIYGGGLCTYSDPGRFFSYRRDGRTGRMASVIALKKR